MAKTITVDGYQYPVYTMDEFGIAYEQAKSGDEVLVERQCAVGGEVMYGDPLYSHKWEDTCEHHAEH